MKKTFVLQFEIVPTRNGKHYLSTKNGFATVWAIAENSQEASQKCVEYLRRHDWNIVSVVEDCRETTLLDYADRPEGKALFLLAQIHGISAGIPVVGVGPLSEGNVADN